MENKSNSINRYSDKDLLEFKEHIEKKLESASQQLSSLLDRIDNSSETGGNDGDMMDDTSNLQDLEMLNTMANRQRKHIQDLKNALIRISNKRYGICTVTGELIDKKRLMAVPTTSKSLQAKVEVPKKNEREGEKKKTIKPKSTASFSRVIKRSGGAQVTKSNSESDDFFEDDEDDDLNLDVTNDINFEDLDTEIINE